MISRRIVIIGGGVIGSSIAFHLLSSDSTLDVIVIERDPSYTRASSRLAMGGIRQQFSSRVNIQLAQYGVNFYHHFDERFGHLHEGQASFHQRGYLFLVNAVRAEYFEKRLNRQQQLGASVDRLEVDQIQRLLPDVVLDDIEFGVFGPQDGYVNPSAILNGLRCAATEVGTQYLTTEVTNITMDSGQSSTVSLKSGNQISTGTVVIAAGAYSAALGHMIGIEVPVKPVRQQLFRCALPRRWPYRFPVVVDPTGVHWRHEDPAGPHAPDNLIVACTKTNEPPGEDFSCDFTRWESEFREPMVRRVPTLENVRLINGWAGLYEMTDDHNPVIGEHPDISGLFLATGFSGHGLMMAPGAGRSVSELILTGQSSIDISAFNVTRFTRDELFWDDAMI